MGDLSDHFNSYEFYVSSSYPDLASKSFLDSNSFDRIKLTYLCKTILEPTREFMGTTIKITSGYRSKELNQKVGGSSTSDHMFQNDAVCCDFVCFDSNSLNVTEFAFRYVVEMLPHAFGQAIMYYNKSTNLPRHCHVSLPTSKNHGEVFVHRNGRIQIVNPSV